MHVRVGMRENGGHTVRHVHGALHVRQLLRVRRRHERGAGPVRRPARRLGRREDEQHHSEDAAHDPHRVEAARFHPRRCSRDWK